MKVKWLILAVFVLGLAVATPVGAVLPTIATTQSAAFNTFSSSNGELGLYLVGTFNLKSSLGLSPGASSPGNLEETVTNIIELANPTSAGQYAWITLWTNNGTGLLCSPVYLYPNGRGRLSVNPLTVTTNPFWAADILGDVGMTGAVKVLITDVFGAPTIGAVGYVREIHFLTSTFTAGCPDCSSSTSISAIRLQPVPPAVLFDNSNAELSAIKTLCGH